MRGDKRPRGQTQDINPGTGRAGRGPAQPQIRGGPRPAPLHPAPCLELASPRCLRPSRTHLGAVNLIKVSEKRCLGAPPGSAALNFIRSGLLLITPAAPLINNGRAASRCQARRGKGFVCLFLSHSSFFFFTVRREGRGSFPIQKVNSSTWGP